VPLGLFAAGDRKLRRNCFNFKVEVQVSQAGPSYWHSGKIVQAMAPAPVAVWHLLTSLSEVQPEPAASGTQCGARFDTHWKLRTALENDKYQSGLVLQVHFVRKRQHRWEEE
jgi:hypothetical protein